MARPTGYDDATETVVRPHLGSRPLAAVVTVETAAGAPAPFNLTQGACVIGSSPDCAIAIPDSTVSRRHVELSLVPEGVHVRDLGSRNGTFYLGQRVTEITLSSGGRIQLGNVRISVALDPRTLEAAPRYEGDVYRGIVGSSTAMRRVFSMLARLEGSLVTVLVEGESGVGKELVARALHEGSSVSAGPLVTVNCGAIPRDLIASELFGHKRGAFTGALETRRGAFESADGGTLFLDEIGELPIDVQPMLLRALESGEVRPVGGDAARSVRVRVVAATNRDLAAEVKRGSFRQDLYYRLAVVKLAIPPLRERPEDIEPLARKFAGAVGIDRLPDEVVAALAARSFTGNARELRNVIQAYAALGALPEGESPDDSSLDELLSKRIDPARPYPDQKEELVERFTRLYLSKLMAHAGGNQTNAAKLAGLDRTYLGRLLAKYGLGR